VNKLHRKQSKTTGLHTLVVIKIPILGYYGVWSYFWGYLATSDAKSDVIFLLGDPNFLYRWQNFAPISFCFRDLTWDRWQTQQPLQKALTLTLTACECTSLIIIIIYTATLLLSYT